MSKGSWPSGNQRGSAFGAASGSSLADRPVASARAVVDAARHPCPCGTGRPYAGCCGTIHDHLRPARTAEALMRSRYSGFALGLPEYLLASWHPNTRPMAMHLEPGQQWLSLEILDTEAGGPGDTDGTVTFRARTRSRGGRESTMSERSRFARHDGAWMYVDGDVADEVTSPSSKRTDGSST